MFIRHPKFDRSYCFADADDDAGAVAAAAVAAAGALTCLWLTGYLIRTDVAVTAYNNTEDLQFHHHTLNTEHETLNAVDNHYKSKNLASEITRYQFSLVSTRVPHAHAVDSLKLLNYVSKLETINLKLDNASLEEQDSHSISKISRMIDKNVDETINV
ncbi:hypothetical protein GQX74_002137 [Glossina fuscipes]|nr:hypothetical protein GQX74_002137 [Glossina fuscipes]